MKEFITTFHCQSHAHCGTCRLITLEGRMWRLSIAKRLSVSNIDFECPESKPWTKELVQSTPEPGLIGKALKAGSQMIGRVVGKEKVDLNALAAREKACSICALLRKDANGEWCGELLRLRFGKETEKKKGCGCLLDEKRKYKNFGCPRDLWSV